MVEVKKIKLTALERSWILYDIGNSAFILLVSTLIPIYFNALATTGGLNESLYLSYWGYAGSVSTLLVAVIGPICGTLADHRGFKKPIFMSCMLLGVLGCAAMGVTAGWLAFLVVFVLAKVGYSSSLVFYDAMLPEITTDERMDTVSSMGYAYGYIGSVIPFILCLLLVLFGDKIGIGAGTAMVVSFLITAVWWFVCTQPLLKRYRQTAFVEHGGNPVSSTFRRLRDTFREVRQQKHIFLYLLAFFFFIDGVYTIIDMATAYGTALGLDTTGLLLITNDGQLAHQLLSPRHHVCKWYAVGLDAPLDDAALQKLQSGIDLGDFITMPAQIGRHEGNELQLGIREGKFHQVKRMMHALNREVITLHRYAFGPLQLGDLAIGEWRPLEEEEIHALKGGAHHGYAETDREEETRGSAH